MDISGYTCLHKPILSFKIFPYMQKQITKKIITKIMKSRNKLKLLVDIK